MAAPHVTGAVALLRQRHPGWTPGQVKSADRLDRRHRWGDTAHTVEAPVLTAGAGLTDVVAANDPKIFTDPVSLSLLRSERQPRPGGQVAAARTSATPATAPARGRSR